MAKRLTPEERQRREEEKARKKREREAAREAKRRAKEEEKARKKREREQAREARRRAKEEEKARKKREKEEKKRQKEIERGQKMKRKPRWLYWLAREQEAKKREHEQHMNAGRVALALGRAIRKIQQKIMAAIGPLVDYAARLKTPGARIVWSHEPWTPQARTRYNWGKKQELAELWELFPDGNAVQDTKAAARDAKRKTKARQIDHAKAIDKALDYVTRELAEDEQNAVTSSLERSYKQVYADIARELEEGRRAIDADRADETRLADARDYTKKGNPRRTAPETQIPRNMPKFGNYGDSVVFGTPSPDQIKAVLNAKFDGKDYSERIWKDRDKLATELKDMMAASIINGENSQIVAQKLAKRMGVEFSHAQRLIRTETSRILNEATLNSAKEAGAEKYQFLAIEDGRTCHQCLRKNRRIYKMSEKKTGLNFPPLHPHCRCTTIARFEWEDDGDDDPTPTTPSKPEKEPGYFERSPIQMTASELEAVNRWITNVETISPLAADAVRDNPTKANAQAAADAQDAAMKAEEQRQTTALGIQRRAIQQGKLTKTEKNSPEISNHEAQSNMSNVATRSANRTTGDRNADRTTTTQEGAMREIAQEIKEEYQAKRTDEEKALIQELVESGRKVTAENIVAIAKGEAGGIVWMETGDKRAGLQHILERHGHDFKNKGIETNQIPNKAIEIATKGELITGTVSATGQKGVLLKMNEDLFIISIGTNGFIVGCYPIGSSSRYEKTSHDDGLATLVSVGIRRSRKR